MNGIMNGPEKLGINFNYLYIKIYMLDYQSFYTYFFVAIKNRYGYCNMET